MQAMHWLDSPVVTCARDELQTWVSLLSSPGLPLTATLVLSWLPYQALDVIGAVLGLVGSVSLYCKMVR